jgi:hypothetical protein
MRLNHMRGTSMQCVADASLVPSCDVYRNHYSGQRVKVTRLATGALCRPQHGSKARSSTSSEEAANRLAAASRVKPGAGTSRDGRRNSARLDLEAEGIRAKPEILGLR